MTVHIVGAGIAGLAAATALLDRDIDVRVYEAAASAGGRCRSYLDPFLDRRIDTGTHVLLGANHAALAYLRRLGALDRMIEMPAAYDFFDLVRNRRRTLAPTLSGLIAAFRPIALAALNTEPAEASWRLTAAVFGRLIGERACRPWLARTGIGDALVDPAVERLGSRLACGRRIGGVEVAGGRAVALIAGTARLDLATDDRVILAVPPWAAADLLPGLRVPTDFRAIVNAHFRVAVTTPVPRLIGMTGGLTQWVLWRGDIVSVTVSAADALLVEAPEALARRFWPEVAQVFDLEGAIPPWRIIKERRATVAATADAESRRPGARTDLRNLVLAGDWIRTGLPGTIDGAVRSGEAAARLTLA